MHRAPAARLRRRDPGRGHRHPRARRPARPGGRRTHVPPAHPPARRPSRGTRHVRADLAQADRAAHLGPRLAGRLARGADRDVLLPSFVPRAPLGGAGARSSTTTPPSPSGRSTGRASPRTRSSTPGPRSATASSPRAACSPTSPTTNPLWAPTSTDDPSEWISGFAIAHGAEPPDPRLPVHARRVRAPSRVGAFDHRTGRAVRREDRGRPAAAVPSRSDALRRTARPDARGRRRPLGRRDDRCTVAAEGAEIVV